MKFTPAQEAAMSLRGKTLLVSAAAGSGKTFTLTHRIIKAITEEGRDITRMLIVTFTRAAAGELRAKISAALSEAISQDPGNTHLQNQILKLGSAKISTIDSFFTEPIRANFEKLGLPASLRLSDEAELYPIRESVMKEVLETAFKSCKGLGQGFLSDFGYRDLLTDLAGIISSARDTSALCPTLLEIYEKLNTSPEGIQLLQKHTDRMEANAKLDFFETEEGSLIKQELIVLLRNTRETFTKIADVFSAPNEPKSYAQIFTEDADRCTVLLTVLESGSYEMAKSAFEDYKPRTIPRLKKDEITENSEKYKEIRTKKLHKQVKDAIARYFTMTSRQIALVFEQTSLIVRMLATILLEFEDQYALEKANRGLCEFSDMPKFMLKLLLNDDGSYTDYADSLYASFDEVYIDEYQDVNEIQDRIFEIVGRDHRFMVGDIKQSIYGFREAEPSIFAAYRRAFPLFNLENAAPAEGRTIFMSNNFRCDENVVDFTNLVCSKIFSAFSESIGYTEDDDLVFSKAKPYETYTGPSVVLNIVEKPAKEDIDEEEAEMEEELASATSTNNLTDEAILTANEIARLIRDEKDSNDKPLQGGKIAVLVRSHSHAKPLAEALNKLNIKYTLTLKTGLFEEKQMKLLLDLLTVIDNPRSDIPLCRLLTAETDDILPYFSFEEVVKLRTERKENKQRSLYDTILRYADKGENEEMAERCRSFESDMTKLRRLSARMPADKFLRLLAAMERYSLLAECDAFTYLYDTACKYVRTGWNGLYNFLKYLRLLAEKGESGKEPEKGDPDAVVIMTIHQSKGLEFNTCFLFGMGKQFNMADTKDPLIYSKEFGLSMKLPYSRDDSDLFSSAAMRYEDTLLWRAGDLAVHRRLIEEEARILYVALTRAKERLYVSGTLSKPFSAVFEEASDSPDLEYAIRKGKTYLSWILLALAKTPSEERKCKIVISQKGDVSLTDPFRRIGSTEARNNATQEEKDYAALLREPYGESEADRLLSTVPAKAAASKVSATMLDEGVFIPIQTGLLFSQDEGVLSEVECDTVRQIQNRIEQMRSAQIPFDSLLEVNKKPTAGERGTATHRFLQFCDYQFTEENGIDSEIQRLLNLKFISKRTADIIDRKSLMGFFESTLYSQIKKAKKVHREFRFGLFRPASDFTQNDNLKAIVSDKKIFVQGSVDLLLETAEGEIILCDYKTDRVTAEERKNPLRLQERMRERHGDQLNQYRSAILDIFGKDPEHIYIYSVPCGIAVEIL